MQTSEDLNVLKHFAKIYNMQCVGFFCFVMKHFLHIYLLKNRSELQLVLLQFVIFFLASLLLIEEVWDGESQYMCKKRHWKNALGRSNNFILFFINFCHFFFSATAAPNSACLQDSCVWKWTDHPHIEKYKAKFFTAIAHYPHWLMAEFDI